MKRLPLALSFAASLIAVFAQADEAPFFAATKVLTLQGSLEATDSYQQADFSRFVAGDGFELVAQNGGFSQGSNATLMGIACFDLNGDGMKATLAAPAGRQLVLSFALEQVQGKPRPLRVEYVGCFDDVSDKSSLSQIFQAQPIVQTNNVLSQDSQSGLKMTDLTPVMQQSLNKRWLVIVFEQQGLREENTGENDLYQFNAEADTVRLTLTNKDSAGKTVSAHYSNSGYSNLLTDMSPNLEGDESQNLLPDMSQNITPDETSNLTPDESSNLLQDLPKNLIQDGN